MLLSVCPHFRFFFFLAETFFSSSPFCGPQFFFIFVSDSSVLPNSKASIFSCPRAFFFLLLRRKNGLQKFDDDDAVGWLGGGGDGRLRRATTAVAGRQRLWGVRATFVWRRQDISLLFGGSKVFLSLINRSFFHTRLLAHSFSLYILNKSPTLYRESISLLYTQTSLSNYICKSLENYTVKKESLVGFFANSSAN